MSFAHRTHSTPTSIPHVYAHREDASISQHFQPWGRGRKQFYPKESSSRLIVRLSSLSVRRRFSILLMECSTVVWCFPPNCRPISGSDADVSFLTMNIATWRGNAITFEFERTFRSCARSP